MSDTFLSASDVRARDLQSICDSGLTGLVVESDRYFTAEALIASVESGAIALLRGRWLVELKRRGGRLERRQDLPVEAFLSVEELRRLIAALGDAWGLLLVAISYRWLTADHPDPDAFHLAIIAQVAELYLKPNDKNGRYSPLVEAFERAGLDGASPDFGVLWDFGSLHQKPRSDAQTALFKQGLAALPMWYGHAATVMWMQPELPEGFGERMAGLGLAETYEASGWCYVESSVSAGVKHNDRRLDLGLRTEEALGWAYGGSQWVEEARLDRVCAARRPPPLAPEAVATALHGGSKKFTNAADVEVVAELYRSYFEGVASTATHLTFAGLQWGDAEAMAVAAVLPRYASITALDLSSNKIGPVGAAALASAPGVMGSLTAVNLLSNGLDAESAATLLKVKAEMPNVRTLCGLTHKETEIDQSQRNLGPGDAMLLASEIAVIASLTSLDLCSNIPWGSSVGPAFAQALAPGIAANGSLTSLNLAMNHLGPSGAAALAPGLAANGSLTKILVSWNQLGDEGTTILCDALRESTVSKVEELDLCGNEIGPDGAKAIAALCAVRGSLMSLDVTYNQLGEEGRAMVSDAVKGREGFTLKLKGDFE